MTTFYGVTSTTTSNTSSYYTYKPSGNLWSTVTQPMTFDCSGYVDAVIKQKELEREIKRKENELQSAFDEVFNG